MYFHWCQVIFMISFTEVVVRYIYWIITKFSMVPSIYHQWLLICVDTRFYSGMIWYFQYLIGVPWPDVKPFPGGDDQLIKYIYYKLSHCEYKSRSIIIKASYHWEYLFNKVCDRGTWDGVSGISTSGSSVDAETFATTPGASIGVIVLYSEDI